MGLCSSKGFRMEFDPDEEFDDESDGDGNPVDGNPVDSDCSDSSELIDSDEAQADEAASEPTAVDAVAEPGVDSDSSRTLRFGETLESFDESEDDPLDGWVLFADSVGSSK